MATPHFVSSSPLLTTHNVFFSLAPISFPLHQNPLNNKYPIATVRCSFSYNFDDDDEEEVFEGAKRNWWSDSHYDDDDTDFEEFYEEEQDEFLWVFKILRAFGWMLPAVAISLLLGTGPNAFIMALAVPLGQSALSFVTKKAWGWGATRNRRSNPKTKKKPFSRAASGMRTNEREEANTREDGQSWVNGIGSSYVKGSSYGGWDELEKRVETKRATNQKTNNNRISKLQRKDRYSRLGRVRDKPLFLRLLIAVFPFLGSWTKLFL